MKKYQHGATTVEFAIIGALMFVLIFAVIEFGRLLWSWGTLAEATRRGARIAAVCPPFGAASNVPARIAAFRDENNAGREILRGFDAANLLVDYLNDAGAPVAAVNCANSDTLFPTIRYVRVRSTYQLPLNIPGLNLIITAPNFETILPAENLGVIPGQDDLQCFGILNAPC